MNYENKGLMATNAQPAKRSPVLAEFVRALAPQQPFTLEQRLAALTDTDRTFMMQLSRMVQAVMQRRIAAGDKSQGYYDLVTQMYGKVSSSKRRLVADILDASDPLDFEPTPKKPREDIISSFYNSPEMQIASEEPQRTKADFLERLTESESSGDSNAEITIQDGRRYVGALQFGDSRLQDYKKSQWLFVYAG